MNYDLVLKNGYVVDYKTKFEGIADIAITAGKISSIASNINVGLAKEVLDVSGKTVIPGIIDSHVHLSSWLGGQCGHKMLARAGVTTALDMSGPGTSVLNLSRDRGVGLNVATIEYVRPGMTVKDTNPSSNELCALIKKVLQEGSIGVKLLGGHYPLTPEATADCIKIAHEQNSYVAFHAGSTKTGSNLEGFLEAVELANGHPLHLAHINAYCRGLNKPCLEEATIAINTLIANPNISSENYLSPMNGTNAACVDGLPQSLVTRRCLITGGFEPTEDGLGKAFLAGWANLNLEVGGEIVLIQGQSAYDHWKKNSDVGVSFAVNPPEPRLCLATAKNSAGQFVVDCISTDGGGIPRNVILPIGLSMVEMQAMTMLEFVQKTSYNPAKMLGLKNKGILAEGFDADITVFDKTTKQADLTIVAGKLSMYKNLICGKGAQIITTEQGKNFVKSYNLEPIVINIEETGFFNRGK